MSRFLPNISIPGVTKTKADEPASTEANATKSKTAHFENNVPRILILFVDGTGQDSTTRQTYNREKLEGEDKEPQKSAVGALPPTNVVRGHSLSLLQQIANTEVSEQYELYRAAWHAAHDKRPSNQESTIYPYYIPGPGTAKGWKTAADNLKDQAFGTSVVKEGYTWILDNYESGAFIILVGFSRGSFVQRCLSNSDIGFPEALRPTIQEHPNKGVSLEVPPNRAKDVDAIFNAYINQDLDQPHEQHVKLLKKYQDLPHAQVKIAGMICFDTVGSTSNLELTCLPNSRYWSSNTHGEEGTFMGFKTARIPPCVQRYYEPRSIDEGRPLFRPTPVIPSHDDQDWMVMFFNGVHSDVGGGMDDPALSLIPLFWSLDRLFDIIQSCHSELAKADIEFIADYVRHRARGTSEPWGEGPIGPTAWFFAGPKGMLLTPRTLPTERIAQYPNNYKRHFTSGMPAAFLQRDPAGPKAKELDATVRQHLKMLNSPAPNGLGPQEVAAKATQEAKDEEERLWKRMKNPESPVGH
ncbi:hypothetical protein MNV49_001721 [Pseudohyphozyma bogoriensis]|nr:hypothetical protein MNV49_001721 [Pseudohyphozyma bogoriensis]